MLGALFLKIIDNLKKFALYDKSAFFFAGLFGLID